MSTIREQREHLIETFTIALDRCIETQESTPAYTGRSPAVFDAQVCFSFPGGTQIKIHPALNLTKDLRAQLDRQKNGAFHPTPEEAAQLDKDNAELQALLRAPATP